mgnify:CR=1 FL=1
MKISNSIGSEAFVSFSVLTPLESTELFSATVSHPHNNSKRASTAETNLTFFFILIYLPINYYLQLLTNYGIYLSSSKAISKSLLENLL